MTLASTALLIVLAQAPPGGQPAAGGQSEAEVELRATIQQYYDAQAQRDPDRAASFWSAGASPRPTREAFLAVFGEPAEDSFTVDVRAVEFRATDVRVRVNAVRMRVTMRNGVPFTQRQAFLNSQLWRKEAAGWKLLRDGPFAEEIADELIAAAPADRPTLYDRHRPDLVQARMQISQRATMAITLGRDYVKGKALFELALEVAQAANDRHGQANSYHNIAQASYFLGDHAGAVAGYEKELALGRELMADDVAASAFFGLATVAYSRAEYAEALGFYREALVIYEKREDGSAIGRAVVSIGNVQYLQAEYDLAAASYRRGLAALTAAYDTQGAVFARGGLARVFAAQGDLAAALEMYGQVLTDNRQAMSADPRTKSAVSATLESVGEIYYRLGNADQARIHFVEARTLAGDVATHARISSSLGLTELIAGKFDAALAAYVESRTKFELAKLAEGIAKAWVGIGFSHTAREKYGDAMAAYRTAIKMLDEQKLEEDAARAWLGLSLAQSGGLDHEAALVSARKVAATAEKVKSADLSWRAAVRAGEALRKLSRFDNARDEFQRAIAAIDRIAAELPINPDARNQLDDSAAAWTGLAFTLAATGQPRAALDAAEARRAHIRRAQLSSFHRDISRGMSPEEQAEEQSLTRDIITTRAQLRAERNQRKPDAARVGKLQQQFTALVDKRAAQQAKLYERLPGLRDLRGLGAAVPAAAAVRLSGDREILLEYLVEEDELLAFTVARGEDGPAVTATLTPIERRGLAEQVTRALQPASLQDAAAWKTEATPIAAVTLAPIERQLAGRDSVIIIPDDVLWRVPFEALPLQGTALAARMRVRYGTSITTLDRQHAAAADRTRAGTANAAIFAAPAIPDAIRTQLSLSQNNWKAPDEDGAIARSTALAALYGDAVVIRTRAAASEPSARDALASADVLHFAGPFQASGAAPLFSFLVLSATGEGLESDGRWELREWFRADLASTRARALVVADGASFGSGGSGSALDAMAWAAAAAGVPSVIVARPPADAFVSDGLMTAFHRELAAGSAVGAAWAKAVTSAAATSGAPSAWTGLRLLGPG